jgi:hypothetical protein
MSKRRTRGQAATEFALVAPIILLLFFGIFDLGRAVYDLATITNAAREGARVAIVNQADSVDCVAHPKVWRCTVIREGVGLGLDVNDPAAVSIVYCKSGELCENDATLDCTMNADGTAPIGCDAVVTVHYTYVPATPPISLLVKNLDLHSTERIAVEYTHANLDP